MEREILARLWTPGFNSAEASQFCIFFPNLEYKLEFIFNQGSINGVPTVCISLLYILEILDWWKSNCSFGPWIFNHLSINTFLPTGYKFVYSCKNPCFRIQRNLEKHFLPPTSCGSIFPEKVVEMLEEMVVRWQEVRWIWGMRQNFVTQFIQLLGLAVRRCHGALGPFCSKADCRYCSFWWSHWFAERTFQV